MKITPRCAYISYKRNKVIQKDYHSHKLNYCNSESLYYFAIQLNSLSVRIDYILFYFILADTDTSGV